MYVSFIGLTMHTVLTIIRFNTFGSAAALKHVICEQCLNPTDQWIYMYMSSTSRKAYILITRILHNAEERLHNAEERF